MIQQDMSKYVKEVRIHRSCMTYLNGRIFIYPFRTLTKRGTMFLRFSLKQQTLIQTARQIKPKTLF